MNTQYRTSTPLFGSSKIARAVLTGVLTLAMGVTGLSSASAIPGVPLFVGAGTLSGSDVVLEFDIPIDASTGFRFASFEVSDGTSTFVPDGVNVGDGRFLILDFFATPITPNIGSWTVSYTPQGDGSDVVSNGSTNAATAIVSAQIFHNVATATFTVDGQAQVDLDTINVPNGTTSVTVVTTTTDAGATAVVTGDTGLTTGNNTVTVVVTAADGVTAITTTFTVVVAAPGASTDATATFTVDGQAQVDLDTINVPNGTTSVTVVTTTTDAGATAVVTGDTGLTTGNNTVTVVVTAADGVTAITTTFTVVVAAPGAPAPAATIANVDVTGTVGSAITTMEAVITLTNDTFNRIGIGANLASFVTGGPTGITITAKTTVAPGGTSVTLVFAGTPTSAVSGAMSITIPRRALASAANLTVTTNADAKFTVVAPDTNPPTVTYSPIHNATDIAITVVPTITFNEAIRNLDDSELTDANVGALVTLKKTDAAGADVVFTATINVGKTVITITPTASLDNNQIYYLGIGSTVEDAAGNAVTTSHARFTTIATAPAPAPVVVSSPSYSAAEVAAIRAANAAALKADEEKAAADKALAEAKAAAEAAAKVAADKVAAEAAAVVKAAADKVEAEARAAAEAVVKAEEEKVAAAVVKAAAVTVKAVVSKSGTKMTLDLPDKYFGKIVTIYVGTTVKGKTTYKKLDFFVLDTEDGRSSITSKVKLVKGQILRVNVGSTVIKSVKI
ncbi:SbsA, Ig-like domain containing protein [Candidatus Nanopelagicaceae bacterium]